MTCFTLPGRTPPLSNFGSSIYRSRENLRGSGGASLFPVPLPPAAKSGRPWRLGPRTHEFPLFLPISSRRRNWYRSRFQGPARGFDQVVFESLPAKQDTIEGSLRYIPQPKHHQSVLKRDQWFRLVWLGQGCAYRLHNCFRARLLKSLTWFCKLPTF